MAYSLNNEENDVPIHRLTNVGNKRQRCLQNKTQLQGKKNMASKASAKNSNKEKK